MPNIRTLNGIYFGHVVNRFSCQQQLYMCILLLVCGRCLAEHCHQNELQICMEHVKPIMQNVTIGFAANADQLNTVCKLFNQGMECIERFVSRCFQESQRLLFRENMAGVEEVMKRLCTDSDYRKEYLTHADCFRSIAPQYEECGGTFRTSVGEINKSNRVQDTTQDKLAQMCGALHRFLECAYGLTSRYCGENGQKAAEFLRAYTEKAVGSLIASTCRKHPESKSRNNGVVEIDEADGLREVIQEDASTPLMYTTVKPVKSSRKGPKKGEGRRSKSTTISMLLSTLPSTGKLNGQPEPARSQKKTDQKSNSSSRNYVFSLTLCWLVFGFVRMFLRI